MLGDGRWEIEGLAAWNASVAHQRVGVSPIDVLSDVGR
jgi:hypothetical protein